MLQGPLQRYPQSSSGDSAASQKARGGAGLAKHLTDMHALFPVLQIAGFDSPQHRDQAHKQPALGCGALTAQAEMQLSPLSPGLHCRALGKGKSQQAGAGSGFSRLGGNGTATTVGPSPTQGSPHWHAALQEIEGGNAPAVLNTMALQPLQHCHECGWGRLDKVPHLLQGQVLACEAQRGSEHPACRA